MVLERTILHSTKHGASCTMYERERSHAAHTRTTRSAGASCRSKQVVKRGGGRPVQRCVPACELPEAAVAGRDAAGEGASAAGRVAGAAATSRAWGPRVAARARGPGRCGARGRRARARCPPRRAWRVHAPLHGPASHVRKRARPSALPSVSQAMRARSPLSRGLKQSASVTSPQVSPGLI